MKNNDRNNSPIGIFDSGIGGLTVLKEVSALLPNEKAVYIGDTARVPYGIKSKETVLSYSRELCATLIEKNVKLIIVACNTASAYALHELQSELSIPVTGVIEPGASRAVETSKSGKIGVIATEATIKSKAYSEAIKSLSPDAEIIEIACPLFVPLAEEGWIDNDVAEATAKKYLSAFMADNGTTPGKPTIDTLVLGCTHYPLLKDTISNIMGSNVSIVDSASATADYVSALLNEQNLSAPGDQKGSYDFYATDSTERFSRVGGNFFGEKLSKVELLKLK